MDYLISILPQLGMSLQITRKMLGLTQREAGELVGLLPKTISALENHPASCSIESLFKYLSALELDIVLRSRKEAYNHILEEASNAISDSQKPENVGE